MCIKYLPLVTYVNSMCKSFLNVRESERLEALKEFSDVWYIIYQ